MSLSLDMNLLFDMPGGDDFEDITDWFDEAATEMTSGDVLLTEGFTLMDAMSAFEIGEPRMDSGMILEQERRPPFDPLAPLLPQELCWILDRSFACEIEWHTGNTLSQTVYTLLYVHHLPSIDPDLIMHDDRLFEDPWRPQGLITIVLRAAMLGLLKCCDLAWRELSKNRVHDTEDWQGEKCDISLLEGTPAEYVIQKLDEACAWLYRSSLSPRDRDTLRDRLLLRKTLLELFKLNLSEYLDQLHPLILIAQNILRRIQAQGPVETPAPGSQAILSLDPYITRKLHNFIPIRVVELPGQDDVWKAVLRMLQGWEALEVLLKSHSLSAWQVGGCIRAWSTDPPLLPAYLRSLAQSALFDRNFVFSIYPASWLVDRFFLETIGHSYQTIVKVLRDNIPALGSYAVKEMERQIIKLTVQHTKCHWFNPPRRRRHLMRSIVQWQILRDNFRRIVPWPAGVEPSAQALLVALPQSVISWQLSSALEVVLSGFQLELYAAGERAVSYWYAARIIEQHLCVLDELMHVVPEGSPTFVETNFQIECLTALQMMSMAMCSITASQVTLPIDRMSVNFKRRYKWLFMKTFPEDRVEQLLSLPTFDEFDPQIEEMLSDDSYSPSNSFSLAQGILVRLLSEYNSEDFWAPTQARDRLQFVRNLADVCSQLAQAVPTSAAALSSFDRARLQWDRALHPWFPYVVAVAEDA